MEMFYTIVDQWIQLCKYKNWQKEIATKYFPVKLLLKSHYKWTFKIT